MTQNRNRRAWLLFAVIAIGVALVLMLIPHPHAGSAGGWLAILPVFFAGIISPLSLLAPLAFIDLGRTPDAHARPSTHQRPPPFRLA
jgi:hypothetical protein